MKLQLFNESYSCIHLQVKATEKGKKRVSSTALINRIKLTMKAHINKVITTIQFFKSFDTSDGKARALENLNRNHHIVMHRY